MPFDGSMIAQGTVGQIIVEKVYPYEAHPQPAATTESEATGAGAKPTFLCLNEQGWGTTGVWVTRFAMVAQGLFAWLLVDKLILKNILPVTVSMSTLETGAIILSRFTLGFALAGYPGWKGKNDLIHAVNDFAFKSLSSWKFRDSFLHPKNWSLPGLVKFMLTATVAFTFAALTVIAVTNPEQPDDPGIVELFQTLAREAFGTFFNALADGFKFLPVILLFSLSSLWANCIGGPGLVDMMMRAMVRFMGPILMLAIDAISHLFACCTTLEPTRLFSEWLRTTARIRQYCDTIQQMGEVSDGAQLKIEGHLVDDTMLFSLHPFISGPYFSSENAQALNFLNTIRTSNTRIEQKHYLFDNRWSILRLLIKGLVSAAFLTICYKGFENFGELGPNMVRAFSWAYSLGAYKAPIDSVLGPIMGSLSYFFLFWVMSIGIVGPLALDIGETLSRSSQDPKYNYGKTRALWCCCKVPLYRWAVVKGLLTAGFGGFPNLYQSILAHDPFTTQMGAIGSSGLMEYPALRDKGLQGKPENEYILKVFTMLKTLEGAVAFDVLDRFFARMLKNCEGSGLYIIPYLANILWSFCAMGEPRRHNQDRWRDQPNRQMTLGTVHRLLWWSRPAGNEPNQDAADAVLPLMRMPRLSLT